MTLQKAIEKYLAPCYGHERNFVVIFRGQVSAYALDMQTAIRQAVLFSFIHLCKSGRFFPAYVRENRTCRIVCRMEARDEVLQLAEAHFGLQLKKRDHKPVQAIAG